MILLITMIKFSHIFLLCVCLAILLTLYEQYSKPLPDESVSFKNEETAHIDPPEVQTIPVDSFVNDESSIPLPIEMTVEENLFGSFYGGRASYFIVDHPEQQLYNSGISSITFSFLDGDLFKSKYHLNRNISNALIEKHGKYKIKAFCKDDKEIIKNQLLYEFHNGKRVLNRALKNYELSWKDEDKLIHMRVNLLDDENPFIYTEQRADYKIYFATIEHFQF